MPKNARKKEAVQPPSREAIALSQIVMPLAAMIRTDLRELVLSLGMQAVTRMLEQERTALCGPRYRHDPERTASRGGHVPSRLSLGGRRVRVARPRVVDRNGDEMPLPLWEELASSDPLDERALEQMVIGVSTRKYERSLEPLAEEMDEHGTKRSAVSRRFIRATMDQLSEWMSKDLGALDLVAILIDGLHFRDHVVLAALGIDATGKKHVLGLWEGATENAAACRALLTNIEGRGVTAERSRLFVIDGSKGLARAIRDVFGRRALVQRCQQHKIENVTSLVARNKQPEIRRAMREAYKCAKPATARRLLNNLARSLDAEHPGAAASLREGLDETLTVLELGLPHALMRSLATTNAIESMNARIRDVARRVRRWRGGSMILRWTAAALTEAQRGFRRLKGHRSMPALVAALAAHDRKLTRTDAVDPHEVAA